MSFYAMSSGKKFSHSTGEVEQGGDMHGYHPYLFSKANVFERYEGDRLLNILAVNSELLADEVKEFGVQGFIARLKTICTGALLDADRIREAANRKGQWRLEFIA